MSLLSIRRALEVRLSQMDDIPRVAWENVAYTPVANEPYFQANLLPAESESPCVGAQTSELVQESGLLQITVKCPIGKGAEQANLYAEMIRDRFPKGTNMAYDGVNVKVLRRGSVAPGVINGEWYSVPVSIPYFSTTFN